MAIITNAENSGNSLVLEALHSSEHLVEGPGATDKICLDPAEE